MQVNLQQLEKQLQQRLYGAYVLSGEETLLVNETADKIRARARAQGFDERIRFEVNNEFDWQLFLQETQAMSLFAEKKLIELAMPASKPGKTGAEQIIRFCEQGEQDMVLLVVCGKVEFKKGKGPAWYQAVEKAGVSCRIWPVERRDLPGWIRQRAKRLNLELQQSAIELLVDRTDGNLLATAQELEKLSLLGLNGKITEQNLIETISNSSHHSIYECIDMALSGNSEQTTKMFYSLVAEHFPAAIMIWALNKEIQKLEQLAWIRRSGALNTHTMMKYQIWKTRQALVQNALSRKPYAFWAAMLSRLAALDRIQKGRQVAHNVHQQILDCLLIISGAEPYQPVNRLFSRSQQEALVTGNGYH